MVVIERIADEPTWRCHQNPFIGALGIQEPVIPGEPLIKRQPMIIGEKFPNTYQNSIGILFNSNPHFLGE